MMTMLSNHPFVFSVLVWLQLLLSLVETMRSIFRSHPQGRLPQWGYFVYNLLSPALVILINIPIAWVVCCTLDNASVIEPIKSIMPWFIFFWVVSFSYLNLFAFAMFFDAFKLRDKTGNEMLKTIPNFLFKQYPTCVIAAFYFSAVATTIILIFSGLWTIVRFFWTG